MKSKSKFLKINETDSRIFEVTELIVLRLRSQIFFQKSYSHNRNKIKKKFRRIQKNQLIHLTKKIKKFPVYLITFFSTIPKEKLKIFKNEAHSRIFGVIELVISRL